MIQNRGLPFAAMARRNSSAASFGACIGNCAMPAKRSGAPVATLAI